MISMTAEIADRFLSLLWGSRKGIAELREISDSVSTFFYHWPKSKGLLLEEVQHMAGAVDIFMGVLLRTEMGRGDAKHTEKETEWLWVDVDWKRGATFGSVLRTVGLDPQIVVDSGHGWHLYWHLVKPVPVTLAQGAMKVLAERLGGDSVGDPARIMRVPGTINMKGDDRLPVRLLRFDTETRLRFSDFDLPEERRIESPEYTAGEMWRLSPDDAPKFGEGERNRGLTSLAGAMLVKGMNDEEVLLALRAENEVRCMPPLPDREIQTIAKSVRRYR